MQGINVLLMEGIKVAGHRFDPDKVHKLHDRKRQKMLPVEEIVRELEMTEDDVVADLGAGSGYFTVPIAKETREAVYAVDVEPKMLDILKENAAKENLQNIHYLVNDLEQIALDRDMVDKVMVAFVLHEVANLEKAIHEMKRILKPGGKGLVLEWEAVESETGPPLAERIPSAELADALRQHGFAVDVSHPSEAHYQLALRIER